MTGTVQFQPIAKKNVDDDLPKSASLLIVIDWVTVDLSAISYHEQLGKVSMLVVVALRHLRSDEILRHGSLYISNLPHQQSCHRDGQLDSQRAPCLTRATQRRLARDTGWHTRTVVDLRTVHWRRPLSMGSFRRQDLMFWQWHTCT